MKVGACAINASPRLSATRTSEKAATLRKVVKELNSLPRLVITSIQNGFYGSFIPDRRVIDEPISRASYSDIGDILSSVLGKANIQCCSLIERKGKWISASLLCRRARPLPLRLARREMQVRGSCVKN